MIIPRHHEWFIGACCAAFYLALQFLSNEDSGINVVFFLQIHWLIALAIFGYWFYLHKTNQTLSLFCLILWAMIFRVIGVFGSPILEDDFFRYLTDGCVFIEHGTPYGIAPQTLFATNQLSAECQDILTWVNHPDIPTIYGPVLQYLFALGSWISPANITVLQIIFSLFDMGLILCLLRLSNTNNVMLYAWCPLVIKEITFTAHPDIVGVFFVFVALVSLRSRHFFLTALFSGLALAAKVFAVIVVPFLIFGLGVKYWLITVLVFALLYLPFLLHHQTDLFVLSSFAQSWTFNASIFSIAKLFLSDSNSRLVCLGIFATLWTGYLYWFHRRITRQTGSMESTHNTVFRGDWLFGVFFALSPVFNPWYLIWLLPFAVIHPSYWTWTIATTASLSYLTGLNMAHSNLQAYEVAHWATLLEYGLIIFAFTLDRWRLFWAREPINTQQP
ncbi:MAG: hypothetical protein GKR96_00325 [Gammaproteobacteria bacterium]|nr:hypothetical protein [Gammaproteobacteria bacterium]